MENFIIYVIIWIFMITKRVKMVKISTHLHSLALGYIVVALFFILVLSSMPISIASPTDNQFTLKKTQVTTSGAAQGTFAIYGDKITWTDLRNGGYDIYMLDLSNSNEIQITTSGSAYGPDIYDDKIVWMDRGNNSHNIYMYDLSTTKKTQITTSGTAQPPVIYGDKIVWVDWRNGIGKKDIYMYNVSTKTETQLTTSESDKVSPYIYRNKIVWLDSRDGNSDVYMYDFSTSKETRITTDGSDHESPSIYDDKVVWTDNRNGYYYIYMYNLSTSKETQITSNNSSQMWPDIYGDWIVYRDDGNANADIYMYDLSTLTKTRITTDKSIQDYPKIYGNKIIWWNDGNSTYDIYMTTVLEKDIEPILPVANFSSDVTGGYAPLFVQFMDLSKNATEWNWNFGDGSNSNEQNPMYTYYTAGNYTVTLKVSNENGTDLKFATINVSKSVSFVFPNRTKLPQDPNNDGLYEDINGNGRLDFADVVTYYNNMVWITQNSLVAYFDYNKNGRIDFSDVVRLYNMH